MNKESTRYYSNIQENKVAKVLNGKKTINSGANKFSAGDVVTDNWLIECKTCMTQKKNFSIKKEWLEKNKEEAFSIGKEYNTLVFDYGKGTERYYIIDEKTFKKLCMRQ